MAASSSKTNPCRRLCLRTTTTFSRFRRRKRPPTKEESGADDQQQRALHPRQGLAPRDERRRSVDRDEPRDGRGLQHGMGEWQETTAGGRRGKCTELPRADGRWGVSIVGRRCDDGVALAVRPVAIAAAEMSGRRRRQREGILLTNVSCDGDGRRKDDEVQHGALEERRIIMTLDGQQRPPRPRPGLMLVAQCRSGQSSEFLEGRSASAFRRHVQKTPSFPREQKLLLHGRSGGG
mmetsp:Transcript_45541/g.96833  ORF Transcript_45541/g.96833 Transcript_45541/m.96833 type:complete len:235 (+) Transcript_45541:350-1054(+)